MFVIDYEQQLSDHGKILVLVRNFDPPCASSLFDQAFASIATHHSVIYPKRVAAISPRRPFGISFKESVSFNLRTTFDEDSTMREQPICMRYIRDYCTFNNSWASFQSHRAVLGLVGMSFCSSNENVISAIQGYLRQKALISEHPIVGRLFILVPVDSLITIEQVNQVISAECQKLLHSLLLPESEVIAHPSDQFFNTYFLQSQEPTTASVSSPATVFNFPQALSRTKSVHPLMLNPRIVRSLSDMVSEICMQLEKQINTVDPKATHLRRLTTVPPGADTSDLDGSESGISSCTAPVVMHARKASDGASSEGSQFNVNPYLNLLPLDNTTTSSTQPGSPDTSGAKQRRNSGRWKKHLADIALQLGEFDLAQLYYDTALQLLRPLMDNLWIAGVLEGLCALAVIRRTTKPISFDYGSRLQLPHLGSSVERELSKSVDFSELAMPRPKRAHAVVQIDHASSLLEALELYKKVSIDERLLEETTFKFARYMVSEKKLDKAIELLDSLLRKPYEDQPDLHISTTRRLNTLIKLYCDSGYHRRACYAAWKSLEQSLRLPTELEFDVLFRHLQVRAISALAWADVNLFTPGSVVNGTSESGLCSISGITKPSHNYPSTLRQPAIPTSLSPNLVAKKLVWYRGASGLLSGRSKFDRASRLRKNKRQQTRSEKNVIPVGQLAFRYTGWSTLQAAAIQHLLAIYKSQINFDDAVDIAWECGLHLIGIIFSLLDGWPTCLDKSSCMTAMEDLCRLAILRSPDQPNVVHPLFETDVSGNADSWKRPMLSRHSEATKLRQFVDLVEIPVHQLPHIRSINLIELPSYLVPRELSKEALASASPILTEPLQSPKPGFERTPRKCSGYSGLFFYAPTHPSSKHVKFRDWVLDEPVDIELMVDNLLPVELRMTNFNIELVRVSLTDPISCDTPGSAGSPVWTPDTENPLIRLEAISVILEKPATKLRASLTGRAKSVESTQSSFSVELNQACLLETAQFSNILPRLKVNPNWRRQRSTLSCTLPANTINIRLIVTVRPNSIQFMRDLNSTSVPSSIVYRFIGLTYRLVDFGAMHVCFRAPRSCFMNMAASTPAARDYAPTLSRGVSVCSSPGISSISMAHSNGESENFSTTSDFLEHPTFPVVKTIISILPMIRIHPPMPRILIFPGIVRSAYTFREATGILPHLLTPSVGKSSVISEVSNDIQPNKFRLPLEDIWSDNPACVLDVSLYPHERRWLPLQLFMQDQIPPDSQAPSDENVPRQLNAFHVRIKPAGESIDFLKTLNLSAQDIVQFVNLSELQQKLPFTIENKELYLPVVSRRSSDTGQDDLNRTPFYASDFGYLWLCFFSDKFWRVCAANLDKLSAKLSQSEESFLRSSRKLFLEIHIEYAVDAFDVSQDERHNVTRPFAAPLYNPARVVSLGFSIHLLSSKHAPLILYHPQLLFQDAPFDDPQRDEDEDSKEEVSIEHELISKSFFCCTLRARLPTTLVPRPIRYSNRQYRVSLEMTHSWHLQDSTLNASKVILLQTPWTTLSEGTSSQAEAPSSPVSIGDAQPWTPTEDLKCVEQPTSQSGDDLPSASLLYQHVAIALDRLGDIVFPEHSSVHLVKGENLRSDELKLPIPADTRRIIRCLEANINIAWKSYLHGRPLHPSSDNSQCVGLPDARLYRFGKFILGAHYAELSANEKHGLAEALLTRRSMSVVPKPWYGSALSTPASILGLLWCHNLVIGIKLADSHLHQLCQLCRPTSHRSSRMSMFSRRLSVPSRQPSFTFTKTGSHSSVMPQITDESKPARRYKKMRRMSVQEVLTPHYFQGLNTNLISSAYRACVQTLEPLAIDLQGFVREYPLDNIVLTDPAHPNSVPIKLARIWFGPVIYEIYQKVKRESTVKVDPTPILSPPLIEGKDYGFIGRGSGIIGLMLESSNPNWFSQCNQIVFYRPGRYWICGMMGIVSPDDMLPSVDSGDQRVLRLPCHNNVETIRFTPSGITVHVHELQT